jgi:hypothetical protein
MPAKDEATVSFHGVKKENVEQIRDINRALLPLTYTVRNYLAWKTQVVSCTTYHL